METACDGIAAAVAFSSAMEDGITVKNEQSSTSREGQLGDSLRTESRRNIDLKESICISTADSKHPPSSSWGKSSLARSETVGETVPEIFSKNVSVNTSGGGGATYDDPGRNARAVSAVDQIVVPEQEHQQQNGRVGVLAGGIRFAGGGSIGWGQGTTTIGGGQSQGHVNKSHHAALGNFDTGGSDPVGDVGMDVEDDNSDEKERLKSFEEKGDEEEEGEGECFSDDDLL